MTSDTVLELIEGDGHTPEPAEGGAESGSGGADGVVLSCPMARRPPRRLWPLGPLDTVSDVTRLGNQPWEFVESRRVLAPDVAHLTRAHDVETILVIGHADCDVVADAYDEYVAADRETSAGVESRIDPLASMVREAVESGHVGTDCPRETLLARLVEYVVVRQVEFLVENESVTATVAGYVHDDDGVYGGFPDTHYLVCLNGERDVPTLRSRVPTDRDVAVDSV